MRLTTKGLQDTKAWQAKGYKLPSFDREAMIRKTKENPVWIHFGAGNIFRGFHAMLMQRLLEAGLADRGIIVGEGFDYAIIDDIYRPHDDLSLLVTLKADGSIEKEVVASVAEALRCDKSFPEEWASFQKYFASDSLEMVTFTITEKGYALKGKDGSYFPFVQNDIKNGPDGVLGSMVSKLTSLMYTRYQAGRKPLALVSTDNCSHNGEKLQNGVLTIAREWVAAGFCEAGFVDYLQKQVAFPWSMIDKITPRPDSKVKAMLEADGFEDTTVVVTDKHTYIAPFVNAEQPQYLVIENDFPAGRPALEKAGVYLTDRDTVNKVERMKVCTCLNPLHTALAVYGCLLGYTLIADEMKDPQLKQMVKTLGYKEGMPVVTDPGILNPKAFIDEVVEKRIPNPFMPDTPQRIATDTSQKLAIRYGETIKAYQASKTLKLDNLEIIPLVFAGWCRYLMAVDDEGNAFTPPSDPRLEEESAYLKGVKLGDKGPFDTVLHPILSDATLFGVDLEKAGLAKKVVAYFTELVAGKGAVRKTLAKYVK